MKEYLFHGGSLEKETFDGHTFWTRQPGHAAEYGNIYVIFVDYSLETLADAEEYERYIDDMTNEENWEEQTRAIRAAVADGATMVDCSDGTCIVNVSRFNPQNISIEKAYELINE